ncbi:ABC transporter ATP-binding protein [Gordonia sp. CPCC 206044]|uniref:ABC transporter ATP-binding protein n=1 Tax=Gordonia sp. CPCC 206044 TaxID=3140793 RepID=UPI003AF3AA9C
MTDSSATPAKISIDNVTKVFGDERSERHTVALEDVSLHVADGEFVTLVGPSGCGKSTLLELIGGLSTPTSGTLTLDGEPITGPGLDRGIVFQQYALLPWRTAQANVELGLEIAGGLGRRERAARAREVLDLVGLDSFRDRYPHELSGGMRQRVAIARSLAYEPKVLLMDEPYAALDAQTRELLQVELLSIWERTGATVVFITHGIEEAVYLGQRVAVMTARPGRIKTVIPIELDDRHGDGDIRSTPQFTHYRHQLWELLHHEITRAARLEAEPTRPEEAVHVG